MDTGKAIFFGLALIALAVFASDMMKPAEAGLMGSGRYMGTSSGGYQSLEPYVWVVDTETGHVRRCVYRDERPICFEWSR